MQDTATRSGYSFEFPEAILEVQALVTRRLGTCFSRYKNGDVMVDSDAADSFRASGTIDGRSLLTVTGRSSQPDKTVVDVTYYPTWSPTGLAVRRWIKEDYRLCVTDTPAATGDEFDALPETYAFEVKMPTPNAVLRVLNAARRCHEQSGVAVNGVYDPPPIAFGTVTVFSSGQIGISPLMQIHVLERSEGSRLEVRYRSSWATSAQAIRTWFDSPPIKCRV
ncbi:MAG: hypothetical protein AAF493_20465 [Pseudomonadota bacterium]